MPTIKPTERHIASVELAAAVNRQAHEEAPSVTAEGKALPSAIAGVDDRDARFVARLQEDGLFHRSNRKRAEAKAPALRTI